MNMVLMKEEYWRLLLKRRKLMNVKEEEFLKIGSLSRLTTPNPVEGQI